jgi:hypothetical protein
MLAGKHFHGRILFNGEALLDHHVTICLDNTSRGRKSTYDITEAKAP